MNRLLAVTILSVITLAACDAAPAAPTPAGPAIPGANAATAVSAPTRKPQVDASTATPAPKPEQPESTQPETTQPEATEPGPTQSAFASRSGTAVARRATPTWRSMDATAEPSQTPDVQGELDTTDLESVVSWIASAIKDKDAARLASVIGPHGTAIYSYGISADPVGHNNSAEIVQALDAPLQSSSAACLGYDPLYGTQPDKALLLFTDLNIPWAELGVDDPGTNVTGFHLFSLDGQWELVFITPVPDYGMPAEDALSQCPDQ
jgi:hypothetical protein